MEAAMEDAKMEAVAMVDVETELPVCAILHITPITVGHMALVVMKALTAMHRLQDTRMPLLQRTTWVVALVMCSDRMGAMILIQVKLTNN
jgi:diadenosine tetraphosphate (Ap4A) HIT family hydrolase